MRKRKFGESHATEAAGSRNDMKVTRMDLDDGRVVMGTFEPGTPAPPMDSTSTDTTAEGGARIVGGDDAISRQDGPGPQVMAADTLEGDNVVNARGEVLGEIRHIMLDVRGGRIAYAVLSSSGFLGVGNKLFAIPWNALTLDAENRCFILDIDKGTLRNAPGFDKDNWPSMGDPRWATEVHSYSSPSASIGAAAVR